MARPRQPLTTLALFAMLAFVAVMLGLIGGRACSGPKARPDKPPPTLAPLPSAPLASVDPVAPLPDVVDAGAVDAMPLVALPEEPPSKRTTRTTGTRTPRETAREPRAVDAGVVVARAPEPPPVVDAGIASIAIADAGTAVVRAPVAPEQLPSAPLVIVYRDELEWLKIVEMRVFIDGKRVIDDKPTDANRPKRGERKLFETRVFPGHHQVRVETTYVGESSGIFDYMNSVRVKMREMVVVEVDAKQGARVLAHAFDRGALEPWEKRPGLRLSTGSTP